MTHFIEPPDRLINDAGEVSYGRFNRPVHWINARDFLYLDEMDRQVEGFRKLWKIHKFNYFGIITNRWIIGLAVVDLSYLGNAFIYLYDRDTGQIHEYNYLSPMARGVRFSDYTDLGVISYENRKVRFTITQDGGKTKRTVVVNVPDVDLSFEMDDNHQTCQPLAMATRNSYCGWTYTQKKAGARLSKGTLIFKGQTFNLDDAHVVFDWTSGFLRHDTYWLWSAGVGNANGHEIGFNFSNGVNETVFTENAIWVDGQLIPVDGVMIEYNRIRPSDQWRVFSQDGQVDLMFTANGFRKDRINTPFVKSNFTQFFGTYTGTIQINGHIENVAAVGFTEKHFARW